MFHIILNKKPSHYYGYYYYFLPEVGYLGSLRIYKKLFGGLKL